jgi:hypothetical protein
MVVVMVVLIIIDVIYSFIFSLWYNFFFRTVIDVISIIGHTPERYTTLEISMKVKWWFFYYFFLKNFWKFDWYIEFFFFFISLSSSVERYTWVRAYSSGLRSHSICHLLLTVVSSRNLWFFYDRKAILPIFHINGNHHVHSVPSADSTNVQSCMALCSKSMSYYYRTFRDF